MSPAAILDALHQPMTFAELRAELLGTAHNGTMSDDRKLSATLLALRKQGRVELRDECAAPFFSIGGICDFRICLFRH